jgi:hypothetical protein
MTLALTLLLALPTPSLATQAQVEATVAECRRVWERTEALMATEQALQASVGIHAGQNPTTVELVYQGGTEADYEADPYAEPFTLHRIVQRKVLPAVGEASVTFQYDEQGRLVFAWATGVDISGVSGLGSAPVDELRVYYHQGEPVKALWDHGEAEPPRQEFVFWSDPSPEALQLQAAGRALYARGEALQLAVRTLVSPTP